MHPAHEIAPFPGRSAAALSTQDHGAVAPILSRAQVLDLLETWPAGVWVLDERSARNDY